MWLRRSFWPFCVDVARRGGAAEGGVTVHRFALSAWFTVNSIGFHARSYRTSQYSVVMLSGAPSRPEPRSAQPSARLEHGDFLSAGVGAADEHVKCVARTAPDAEADADGRQHA